MQVHLPPGTLPMTKDPMKYLHQSIKKFISTALPGKHVHEKASNSNTFPRWLKSGGF